MSVPVESLLRWGYIKGPCKACGYKSPEEWLLKGHCLACRHPEAERELIKVGVPCGTVSALVNLAKKCVHRLMSDRETEKTLVMIYPRLMENVKFLGGLLSPKSRKYVWVRNKGWHVGTPEAGYLG